MKLTRIGSDSMPCLKCCKVAFSFLWGTTGTPTRNWPFTSGDRDFHSRRREAYKIRIGAPSTLCTVADSKSATQQTGPSCLRACRQNWRPSEPERFRSRSRRRRRRHHHRQHDEVPDQAARPMSAPAEPRPVHSFSPPARPPYRSASSQTTPEPWSYDTAHSRSPDASPERPPGQWQPPSFTAPSQRPALPRFRPPPSKAEDPLLRAAETAWGSGSKLLPVLRSPIFKRQRHPRHHQNIRPPKALRSLLLQLRSSQLTMSRCFKQHNAAAMNSCEIRFHSEPKAAMLWTFTRRA